MHDKQCKSEMPVKMKNLENDMGQKGEKQRLTVIIT